jgi:serine/threonine-protein kinase HipA
MLIHGHERSSQLANCVAATPEFLMAEEDAITIVNHQVRVVKNEWETVCNEANLSQVDRTILWRRQFLSPSVFLGVV